MPLLDDFHADAQGAQFSDVSSDTRIDFAEILAFLDSPERRLRMLDAELHHDRPALAGVVRELESLRSVHLFFATNDGHTTRRFRQAVGVAVRIVMQDWGWRTTGRKGSLGVRASVPPQTLEAGAYHNTGGLSVWFTRAERYQPPVGVGFRSVEDRAKELDARLTDRIVATPDTCGGAPRILGTRISVKQVVLSARAGMTPADMVKSWPHLNAEDIEAVLVFYEAKRDEIDADIENDERWLKELMSNPAALAEFKAAHAALSE